MLPNIFNGEKECKHEYCKNWVKACKGKEFLTVNSFISLEKLINNSKGIALLIFIKIYLNPKIIQTLFDSGNIYFILKYFKIP